MIRLARGAGVRPPAAAHPDERGAVAGLEVLPFSVLIFVCGTLLLLNAWAVIDAKLAVSSAAREAARTYGESREATSARAEAVAAGREAFAGHGRDGAALEIVTRGSVARCAPISVTATATVPAIAVPIIGGLGTMQVAATHTERVDGLRSGLDGETTCA